MNDVRFSEPITLKFQSIGERKAASSWEAMECMNQQWPERARGQSWREAYRARRDALDGWRMGCEARTAKTRNSLMVPPCWHSAKASARIFSAST